MEGIQILCEASILLGWIEHVAWPSVVFFLVVVFLLLFHKEVRRKIQGIQEAGLWKAKIIFAESRENTTQRATLVKSSETSQISSQVGTAFNERSLRILRALFGEEKGRLINNYKRHYRAELSHLLKDKYVQEDAGRYSLTEKGEQITRQYLLDILTGSS